jgi:hypothetical protein
MQGVVYYRLWENVSLLTFIHTLQSIAQLTVEYRYMSCGDGHPISCIYSMTGFIQNSLTHNLRKKIDADIERTEPKFPPVRDWLGTSRTGNENGQSLLGIGGQKSIVVYLGRYVCQRFVWQN